VGTAGLPGFSDENGLLSLIAAAGLNEFLVKLLGSLCHFPGLYLPAASFKHAAGPKTLAAHRW
jgi:hypothetical protein